jgi:DNA-binding transcriptional LysR family regulator
VRIELLASGDSAELRARVADGALDVAVASLGTGEEAGVRVAARGEQRFVVVAPVDTKLPIKNGRVERARLLGLPVVALAGEGLRTQLDDVFASLGATPDISIETSEREMLIPLVAAGLGITLVPEGFVRQRSAEGLTIYELTPAVTRSIGAVVPAGDVPATVAAFVVLLAEHGELKLTATAARRTRSRSRAR